MLALGVQRVTAEGLDEQIMFTHRVLPDDDLTALGAFDAVVSTNSLHHFHDPSALWDSMRGGAATERVPLRPGPDATGVDRCGASDRR